MKKLIFSLIFFLISIVSFSADLPVIAVYGFESSAFQSNVVMGYTKILESALFDRSLFRIVDRQSLEKIFQEQKLSVSGTVDTDKRIIELGKLAGASYIVLGSLDATPSGYIVGIRILDVNTGMIEFSDSRSVSNIVNVDNEIRNMASQVNLDSNNRIIKGNRARIQEEPVASNNKTTTVLTTGNSTGGQAVSDSSYKSATLSVNKYQSWNTSLELDTCMLPKIAFTKRDAAGRITGNFGFNLGLGVSWKNYTAPLEVGKFNNFYRFGTVYFVIPFVGIGGDYLFDSGLYIGAAIDLVCFIAPIPTLSGGWYF